MPLAMRDFWRRAVASGLLSIDRAKQLHEEFRRSAAGKTAPTDGAVPLARWLIAQGVMSPEQARALLTGKVGPGPSTLVQPSEPASVTPTDGWEPPAGIPTIAKSRRRAGRGMIAAAAIGIALVAAVVVGTWSVSTSPDNANRGAVVTDAEAPEPTPPQPTATIDDAANDAEPAIAARKPPVVDPNVSAVDDDGQTLWMAPTAGPPLALDALPSGMQVLLAVRLAELGESDEGRRVLAALGPEVDEKLSAVEHVLGVARQEIDQLSLAFVPDESGSPKAALAVRLRQPLVPEEWMRKLAGAKVVEHQGKAIVESRDWAYYLPTQHENRVLVAAPVEVIKEVIERSGPPILRRGFENLLRHSDAQRQATLVFAPAYLATDGESLLAGPLEGLRDPLAQFFDVRTEAVMLSAHLGEALFVELRTSSPVELQPDQASAQMARSLANAAEAIERQVASSQPSPYGRLVLNRYPRMMQMLADFSRAGADDRQAVLRAYLPLSAGHNLVLATQLWLSDEPQAQSIAETPPAKPIDAARSPLERTVSLSFPRDTLERSLELLAKEIDTPIVILGRDLQLEGITKNQSFGIDLRDRKAGEVLREILRLANPDGKLVYVIRPRGQAQAIYITTRAAAAKRGEPLPAELAEPEK